MPFDLEILVLNQDKPCKLPFSTKFDLLNEIDNNESIARYHTIWPYMTQSKGIWYSIINDKDEISLGALRVCNSDFEVEEKDIEMPYWVKDDDIKGNLTPLIIIDEYYEDFVKTLEYLIQQSPSREIMFLSRYQGGDEEIICGILKFEVFINLLNERKILFNVCYIVRD